MHAYMHTYPYIHTFIQMHTYVHTYPYIHTHLPIHTYTNMHANSSAVTPVARVYLGRIKLFDLFTIYLEHFLKYCCIYVPITRLKEICYQVIFAI